MAIATYRSKALTRCVPLICVQLVLLGCNAPRGTYPGWEYEIGQFEKGISGLIQHASSYSTERLVGFLELNKTQYFGSEMEFERFLGTIDIIEGRLVSGLSRWRSSHAGIEDHVKNRMEFRRLLSTRYLRFTDFLIQDYQQLIVRHKIELGVTLSQNIIPLDESLQMHMRYSVWPEWYLDQLTLIDGMKAWDAQSYIRPFARLKDELLEDASISTRHMTNPEYFKWLMEMKEDNPEYEHLIDYHEFQFLFLRGEFEKAFDIAVRYDFDRRYDRYETVYNRLEGFLWNVPYIFYASGNLDRLIPFYESLTEDDFIGSPDFVYGGAPMEFWLAAAYAERQEFDTALEYLRDALAAVTMWERRIEHTRNHLERNHLVAVLWFSYMSTAMDPFREVGRFDEVEALLERRLADFRHLEWIR